MELWNSIRQRVLRDGVSIRQIQRETGLHFKTIKKILSQSCPPPFKSPERVKPKIGPYLERIAGILESDMALPESHATASGPSALNAESDSPQWGIMLLRQRPRIIDYGTVEAIQFFDVLLGRFSRDCRRLIDTHQ